jgi:hypothetical protein
MEVQKKKVLQIIDWLDADFSSACNLVICAN